MIGLLLWAILSGGNPAGATWIPMGSSPLGPVYLDTAHIEREGLRARVWERGDYPTPVNGVPTPVNGVSKEYFRNEYDCGARTYALLSYRSEDINGRTIYKTDVSEAAPHQRGGTRQHRRS